MRRGSVWLARAGAGLAALALLTCAGGLGARAPRIDLVHMSFYNACAIRAYGLHWQHPERYPEPLRFNLTNSPDSVLLVAVWVRDGSTFNSSWALPLSCPP